MMTISVNLNADMGEGFGAYNIGNDDAILKIIRSASIACGFHAGDALTMRRVLLALGECLVEAGHRCDPRAGAEAGEPVLSA